MAMLELLARSARARGIAADFAGISDRRTPGHDAWGIATIDALVTTLQPESVCRAGGFRQRLGKSFVLIGRKGLFFQSLPAVLGPVEKNGRDQWAVR